MLVKSDWSLLGWPHIVCDKIKKWFFKVIFDSFGVHSHHRRRRFSQLTFVVASTYNSLEIGKQRIEANIQNTC